ncbi:dynamin family protein [Bacillaceae bacterium]
MNAITEIKAEIGELHHYVDPKRLYERLLKAARRMKEAGDDRNGEKLAQVARKLAEEEWIIAFCGHFSAGKSSMINRLLGAEILPSSPIPTSANLVKIKAGPSRARVHLRGGKSVEIAGLDELAALQRYMVDGETVEAVEISHPCPLPEGVAIMDTPGIDSTDDAHRLSTESALHLADVILYVTDYNHVLSELNFRFVKKQLERGKRVYFIVNQIDKHNEWEISFAQYRASVQETFAKWEIEPQAVYFTTLQEEKHPENEIERLQEELVRLVAGRKKLLTESALRTALSLIDEHGAWRKERIAQVREELLRASGGEDAYRLQERCAELEKEQRRLSDQRAKFAEDFRRQLQSLLDNANLMPYEVRELARRFLESRRPGFRVGILFAAAKTKTERERRLAAFHEKLQEQVKANLDWHVKELLRALPEKYGIKDEGFAQEVYALTVPLEPSFLLQFVKEGALSVLTGEYVLQYTKELAEAIKSLYRSRALALFERAEALLLRQTARESEGLEREREKAAAARQAAEALRKLDEEERAYLAALQAIVTEQDFFDKQEAPAQAPLTETVFAPAAKEKAEKERNTHARERLRKRMFHDLEQRSPDRKEERGKEGRPPAAFPAPRALLDVKDFRGMLEQAADRLDAAAALLAGVPGFQTLAPEWRQRAQRLRENLFTVALFGAFSAGKSSFANALLGERVLPVSPNPTTAAINRILPPKGSFAHGTVHVQLKNREKMTLDLKRSLSVFGIEAATLEEAVERSAELGERTVPPQARPHYAFLQAAARGWNALADELGKELLVDLAALPEYVAKEEISCFVEAIDIYFACPLTQQGVVLVDTPGADSINARHTGVAFDYIKNADAVLYVTYYNHAFSRADREFLIQLGRVKDAFEMDKMFFIVNAADLAASREELERVVAHVRDNLHACGIRSPRIYPVSSQTALLAKWHAAGRLQEKGDAAVRLYRRLTGGGEEGAPADAERGLEISGIRRFEKDFLTFTIEELTETAVQAARGELARAEEKLARLLAGVRADESEREKKRKEFEAAKDEAVAAVEAFEVEAERRAVAKEIDELLYYVKQRVFLRFPELFQGSFNPAVLKESGREAKKALTICFEELQRSVAHDLAQELRATALRVERYLNRTLQKVFAELAAAVRQKLPECSLSQPEEVRLSTPEFPSAFAIAADDKRVIGALSAFKNPKHFFEENGKEKMREELGGLFHGPVAKNLAEASERLKTVYLGAFSSHAERIRNEVKNRINEFADAMARALTMVIDAEKLAHTQRALQRIRDLQ